MELAMDRFLLNNRLGWVGRSNFVGSKSRYHKLRYIYYMVDTISSLPLNKVNEIEFS